MIGSADLTFIGYKLGQTYRQTSKVIYTDNQINSNVDQKVLEGRGGEGGARALNRNFIPTEIF